MEVVQNMPKMEIKDEDKKTLSKINLLWINFIHKLKLIDYYFLNKFFLLFK